MLVFVSAVLGAVLGGYQAKKRGGNAKDVAQYSAGYGIAFCLLGLMIAIMLDRFIV